MSKHFKSAAIASHTNRRAGRIRRWRTAWGFISPSDPTDTHDVFLHYDAVPDEADRQLLRFGAWVEYELDPAFTTPRAVNVRVI
jgi:cold shock CspA family protein